MKRNVVITLSILAIILSGCINNIKNTACISEIRLNDSGQYRIFVNGEEFYVNGAGCEGGDVKTLAENGANSFRTWMDQEIRPTYEVVLNDAQKYGLKVLMGLEVGRERHGFNYDDSVSVALQYENIKAKVLKYKDHPALLGWVIGNEINLRASNLKVYDAVNDISKMIKEIDGNHVTTFTIAGISKKHVDYIKEHCKDVDFLSIQMYGSIVRLQKRLRETGWDGPYMVTEWGATGHWEVQKTEWKAAIEPTSKEKAESFIHRYKTAIDADKKNCLGSYVFFWGQKQERTPTWYGMFTEEGNITETVDAMHYIWNNKWPENRCPSLESLTLNNKLSTDNIRIKSGEDFTAKVVAKDYENDSLTYRWEILPESTDLGHGGDFETRPETLLNITAKDILEAKAPVKTGAYRLFIYVSDMESKVATANIPFIVEG